MTINNENYHEPISYKGIVEAWANRKTTSKAMINFFKVYASMSDEQRINIFEDMNNMIDYREAVIGKEILEIEKKIKQTQKECDALRSELSFERAKIIHDL